MNFGVYARQAAIIMPHDRLSDWAGLLLTDEEAEQVVQALPESTLI